MFLHSTFSRLQPLSYILPQVAPVPIHVIALWAFITNNTMKLRPERDNAVYALPNIKQTQIEIKPIRKIAE